MNELKMYLEGEIKRANAILNSDTDTRRKEAVSYHLMRCEDALIDMDIKAKKIAVDKVN